jgi:DNA-binding MarR family transcriptional regulator
MVNKTRNDSGQLADDIVDCFVRIMNKAASIEKEPVDIGHGILLHASEVHLIDIVGRYPQEGISQIASRLGITKGAVSQTAKRLEGKGYLVKGRREGDQKTVLLALTEQGSEAFVWHRAYHKITNNQMAGHLVEMSPRDVRNLMNVFLAVENMFDNCPAVRVEVTRQLREDQLSTL